MSEVLFRNSPGGTDVRVGPCVWVSGVSDERAWGVGSTSSPGWGFALRFDFRTKSGEEITGDGSFMWHFCLMRVLIIRVLRDRYRLH